MSNCTHCTHCHSDQINPSLHGRNPTIDLNLCDVCYWRKRADPLYYEEQKNKNIAILVQIFPKWFEREYEKIVDQAEKNDESLEKSKFPKPVKALNFKIPPKMTLEEAFDILFAEEDSPFKKYINYPQMFSFEGNEQELPYVYDLGRITI